MEKCENWLLWGEKSPMKILICGFLILIDSVKDNVGPNFV
jgi:hypothetical protein